MITLALDTCLGACQAAVLDGEDLVSQCAEPMSRGHQERLAPMVREVAAGAGLKFSDIDRIGVTVGPGSFTGLRVGLAFAKGLALALDRPCVAVECLPALAASLDQTGPLAAIIDGGRGNLYLQLFADGVAISGPDVVTLEIAAARLAEHRALGPVTLVGPGAGLLADLVSDARCIILTAPTPEAIVRLAARAPIASPRPLYMRPPDALPKSLRSKAP